MSNNEVCNTVHCPGYFCNRWSTCAHFHSSGSTVDWSAYGSGGINANGLTLEPPLCGDYSDPPHAKYKPIPNELFIQESGVAVGKIGPPLFNTIQIDKCERIILKDKSLEFSFELAADKIKDYDTLIINGIKFSRVEEESND